MFSRRSLLAKSPFALLFPALKSNTLTYDDNPAFKIYIKNIESKSNLAILDRLYPCGYNVSLETYQNLISDGWNSKLIWPITGKINFACGTQKWFKEGLLHREDGPACIYANRWLEWYRDGQLHREDGPAVIQPNGTQHWYQKGQFHREDGPAITNVNGYQAWYVNGIHHREDGPAIIHPSGKQEWCLNGKLHREDGPAITHANGHQQWYLHGVRQTNFA